MWQQAIPGANATESVSLHRPYSAAQRSFLGCARSWPIRDFQGGGTLHEQHSGSRPVEPQWPPQPVAGPEGNCRRKLHRAMTEPCVNDYHGSVWEFGRNSDLDARNFFNTNRLPYNQHQYGIYLGGPVMLPYFNGKNNTWVSGYWEGFRAVRSEE